MGASDLSYRGPSRAYLTCGYIEHKNGSRTMLSDHGLEMLRT